MYSAVGFGFQLDLLSFYLHQRVYQIRLSDVCMYFAQDFFLVSLVGIERLFTIRLFFDGKFSPSEAKLQIFFDSLMPWYEIPELLLKLNGLLIDSGLDLGPIFVSDCKYLFFLAAESSLLLLDD